ncbi:hypothetical protein GCM10010349_42780 [Streptomyces flavofungini]|nr:hypothetical protein GCM10010349_42780 [Streptomyces flavofungini]
MPTTPIIAAMPIAMPRAERKTRMGRERRPEPPVRTTSAGLRRAGLGCGAGHGRGRGGVAVLMRPPVP